MGGTGGPKAEQKNYKWHGRFVLQVDEYHQENSIRMDTPWNCFELGQLRRGKFSTNLRPSGRIRQVRNMTGCHNFGTINLNSIGISTCQEAPYKQRSSVQIKGLGTNWNLPRNAQFFLHGCHPSPPCLKWRLFRACGCHMSPRTLPPPPPHILDATGDTCVQSLAELPPPQNQIYSWFWHAFSLFLRKFHYVKPFNGNFCEPGRARFAEEKMEIPSQVVSKTYSTLFSAKFEPFLNPFRGRTPSTFWINLFTTWLV